jgi:hypothetical protein
MNIKRLFTFVAAVLFGILVWLGVAMRDQFQTVVHVPVTIADVPAGWAIRTAVPRSIEVKLRGDGWQVAALLLGPEPHLTFPLNPGLPYGLEIPDTKTLRVITFPEVVDRLSLRPGVQCVDVEPDSLFLALDRAGRKTVPVIPSCALSFREGYGQVGTVTSSPESVTVMGAESVLRGIESWKTAHVVFDGLKAPVDARVSLAEDLPYVLSLSTPDVRLQVNVQPFAEKIFNGLTVELMEAPTNREVILIPPKIDIIARGGIRQLATLDPVDFRVWVDYRAIVADSTGVIEPDVMGPAGVQVVSRRPERLQYVVRKRL